MIKISVIVPVYNTEKYLKECLDTIINQTLKEIEIILINNGSTDRSGEILDYYKNCDNRIKIIENKKNITAGAARNQGLEVATGEYLSFLDSDDYFELNMLEEVYEKCKSGNTDIGIFDATAFDNQTKESLWEVRAPYFLIKRFEEIIYTNKCKDVLFNISQPCAWNKIFKTDFIKREDIKFQDIFAGNDLFFVCKALLLSNSISYINKSFLHYRQNRNESLTTVRNKKATSFYSVFKYTKKELSQYNKIYDFAKTFFKFSSENLMYLSLGADEQELKLLRELQEQDDFFEDEIFSEINKENDFEYNFFNDILNRKVEKISYMKLKYSYYFNKIKKLVKMDLKNIAIWGAGIRGKAFLNVFKEILGIKYVIDNDNKKHGNYLESIEIKSFYEVKNEIDTIIVTNEKFYEDILREVKKLAPDIKVIDINSYLDYQLELKECID